MGEYKEQLSGVGDQMKQLQEALKRQQEELQAVQRCAELGMATRQHFEAKDGAMEALQKEADRLLKEKDDTIHTLRAEV